MTEFDQSEKCEVIRMYGHMVSEWVPADGIQTVLGWLQRAHDLARTMSGPIVVSTKE